MNKRKTIGNSFYVLLISLICLCYVACKDDYYGYKEPDKEILGESIYDWLDNNGHFTYYLRIVESVQDAGTSYAEVLKKTGTKTVFVANDSAFEAFFSNNTYGIKTFDDFTVAQKRAIFFSGMLNDAYLLEMMSSTPGASGARPNPGQAMRRYTAWAVLDSVPYEQGEQLPDNPYWTPYKAQGIHILKDNSQWTMVHFLEAQMRTQGISEEDFRLLTKTQENPEGVTWNKNDAYIFNVKIIQKDVTCKNGYINILEKVLLPPDNLAEYIRKNPETRLFNRFLERYCAPFVNDQATEDYLKLNPDFSGRIYVKSFFTDDFKSPPDADGRPIFGSGSQVSATLKFDPGKNDYTSSVMQADMAAMFIPTDAALNDYFNNGGGKFLKERYGTWDNVPDDVLSLLVRSHMRSSFLQSTPDRFDKIENEMGTSLNIQKSDLKYTAICSNGAAYVVNRVYPPSDYASVMTPIIVNEATRIMNWAVQKYNFKLYLLSLENRFSFIVPVDDKFNNYISPVSVGWQVPERWRFVFNDRTNVVDMVRYNMAGDSIGLLRGSATATTMMDNALMDILDNHIVVGDIEDGKTYYPTKGGATIKVTGRGVGMRLDGGGNSEHNETVTVINDYNQENGKTYLIDKIMQTPVNSVYTVLGSKSDFSEFYALCLGVTPITIGNTIYGGYVFYNDPSGIGVTPNVSFFNTFNYTVYVPTNAAMQEAHRAGRYKTLDEIEQLNLVDQGKEMQKLYEFLRNHFQDNSVYIGGEAYSDTWFETAAMDPVTNKFRRLWVTNTDTGMTVRTKENGGAEAAVITSGGLYNIMARDYKFNSKDIRGATMISTSSYAVIHQINAVLDFNKQ